VRKGRHNLCAQLRFLTPAASPASSATGEPAVTNLVRLPAGLSTAKAPVEPLRWCCTRWRWRRRAG
jgi:hypothetical protein